MSLIKKIVHTFLIIFVILMCSGCYSENTNKIENVADLYNKNVGIYNGSEYDKFLKNSDPVYYNTYSDEISALKSGKIDAFLTDEPLSKEIIKNNADLKVLSSKLTNDSYAFALNKENVALKNQIDATLIKMKNDGTLKRFEEKWMNNSDIASLEKYNYSSSKTLKFATVSGSAPFSFLKNNEIVGYDIDVIKYIGYKLNYNVDIIEMTWDGVLPSIISGKADIAGCSIIVTEDRKKSVLFTEPDYTGGIVVVTLKDSKKPIEPKLINSFKRTLVDDKRYLVLLKGFLNTIIMSLSSICLGSFLGIIICLLRNKKNSILDKILKLYIKIIQGIPITLLLLIFYYVIFSKLNVNAIIIAIITFSIYFSAYIAELLRGAIKSINRDQILSAYSLGFTKLQTFKYVVFPQLLIYTLPAYKNEVVSLIKLTSIAGYISIIDITKASDLIRNRTYESFAPLIVAAILYYIICAITSKILNTMYKKMNKRGEENA